VTLPTLASVMDADANDDVDVKTPDTPAQS
jgi:hypothetical protein